MLRDEGKFSAAEELTRECLRIREQRMPESWVTDNTCSRLGADLLGQSKYEAAEPLLVSGYEGMKEREDTIPRDSKRCLKDALDRLVQLYEAWDKANPNTGKALPADEWRKRRAALEAAQKDRPLQAR